MSDNTEKPRNRLALWLPLAIFGGLFALFVHGLMRPADNNVPSTFVGNPLPQFDLPAAAADRPGLATSAFRTGKPRLLNVFASWCVPCAAEAPQLAALAQAGVDVEGVAIHDRPEDLARFLANNGNPYAAIGRDDKRVVQIAIGSSGVPETYVIDGQGVIRYQHIGDIRADDVPMLLGKLKEAASKGAGS
ncbi:DsbE family thiol:disulfide interchange protein [Novosphingobium sp. Fuku2-ISO-50]|uniref:DsbE family thiol:disulfide interchange protein n=1 Tax=Novosphingobium sp. Fuku2-ISO-50 TaxID=1739114 RepID=UPI00076BC17B|nr:DsbE family thiol:disulfide interchange protein [Novosphingobium sp. Fuku2-ISO-50]KUR81260.1 alkyl hydroperoxide reductase [Novosphingobium sp. Fuku2-ISO-50]